MTTSAEKKSLTQVLVNGIPAPYYLTISAIICIIAFSGNLPDNSASTIAFLTCIGAAFQFIGKKTPVIGKYCGFGALLPIFGSSLLVTMNLIPESIVKSSTNLVNNVLLPFQMSAILGSAIIGKMDKNMLKKAALRYFPVILIGQIVALACAYFVGLLFGYDIIESVMYVAFPCMAGGSGGAMTNVPLLLSEALGIERSVFSGPMMAALSLANIEAILGCVILDQLGKKKPEWTGNGVLMRNLDLDLSEEKRPDMGTNIPQIAAGVFLTISIYIVAITLQKFFSFLGLHYVVWIILICLLIKLTGCLPRVMEDSILYWGNLLLIITLPVLMAGIGIANIDLVATIQAINLPFFILVTATVIGFVVGSMIGGQLLGFYPVEAGISVGCCSVNIGGTGDLICCDAANRMELFPFAAISTRIGGAMALTELGLLIGLLGLGAGG